MVDAKASGPIWHWAAGDVQAAIGGEYRGETLYSRALGDIRRVDDFDRAWDELDRDPVNQRWQQFMSRFFEPLGARPGERFPMMKEIFHLE